MEICHFTEEHYKNFLENSSDLIHCVDSGGKIIYVNDAWKENMGYTDDEISGLSLWDIIHPKSIDHCKDIFKQIFKGETVPLIEVVFVRKNGHSLYVNGSTTFRRDSSGKIISSLGVFQDVTAQKKAEQHITALASVVEQSDDIIVVKDLKLRIIAANKAYAMDLGYVSADSLIGKTLAEILGISEDIEPAKSNIIDDKKTQMLKPGGFILREKNMLTKSGKTKTLMTKKYPIFDKNNKLIGTGDISRDISDIKESLKKLEESETNLKLLITQMMLGLAVYEIIFDDKGNAINYRFISVNKKFEEQSLLKAEAIIGKTILEVFPETGKYWMETFEQIAINSNSIEYENQLTGINHWLKFSGYYPKPGYFAVITDDITEQKQLENSLFQEREQLKMTLLSVGDGIISTDNEGNIVLMNAAAEKLIGWKKEKCIGKQLEEVFQIINSVTRVTCENPIKSVLKSGGCVELSDQTILLSKTGSEIFVQDTASPIKDMNGNIIGIIIVFRDCTEKLEKQKEIEYMSLHDSLTGIYNRRYMQDSIQRLDTERNLPFSIIYIDVNGLKLINDAFGHETGDKLLQGVAEHLKKFTRSDDIIGRLGGDEFLILLPKTDVISAETIKNRILNSETEKIMEILSASFAIGYSVKSAIDEDIREIFNQAESNMYQNKLKFGKIVKNQIIWDVVRNINSKYKNEQLHSEKVSLYSAAIAKAMGLSDKEISDIKITAVLHDIGKIMVPEKILKKPGKLTKREFEIIKRHPETGYQILRSLDEYRGLAETVLHHHEHWDGKGYPDGLKMEDIDLYARIIAIADAYESITTGRPYKNEESKENAIKELKKCSGKQFDPKIVKIFIEKVLAEENIT